MIDDKDYDEDKAVQEDKKIIINDQHLREKVISLWKEWKELERTSRREDRAQKE